MDKSQTKEELIAELAELRHRVDQLEEAEAAQRATIERLRHELLREQIMFDTAQVILVALDADGVITLINRKGCETLGYERAELIGRNWFETCLPESVRVEMQEVFSALMAGGIEPVEYYENHVLTREGVELVIAWRNALLTDESGQVVGTLSSGVDVTAHKQDEERLLRLSMAVRGANDSIVLTDLRGVITDVNEAAIALWGERDALVGRNALDLIAPEDRGLLEALRTETLESEECRIITQSGELVPVEVSVAAIKGADGAPLGFVGIARDIREQKRMVEALRVAVRQWETTFNAVNDAICLLDLEGKIVRCNEAMDGIVQKPMEELVGRSCRGLLHDVSGSTEDCLIPRVLASGRAESHQVPVGERWFETHVTPVLDRDGGLFGAVHIMSDITERRQAEEVLRQRNQALEFLVQAGRALSSNLELDQVLATLLEQVRQLLGAVASSVWLLDPKTGELVCREATGPEKDRVLGWRLAMGEGIAGWVVQHEEGVIVPDALLDERHYRDIDHKTGLKLRSILSVPLRYQRTIGVLQVVDTAVDRFSEADLMVLESLAPAAAVAIEGARLVGELRSRSQRLALLNRIAGAIQSTLELDELVETVYREIGPVFQPDAFFIAFYDEVEGKLDFRLSIDKGRRVDMGRRELDDGLASRIARENVPLLFRNLREEQEILEEAVVWGTMEHAVSWLGVPMCVGEKVLGVISVQTYRPDAYDVEDQLLLSTIADQVAVAVENGRLFQAEREQRHLAEVLQEAASLIDSSLDLDQVLDYILVQAGRIVGGDAFNVMLIEDGHARVVHWLGYDRLGKESRIANLVCPIADYATLAEMLRTGEPIVVPDAAVSSFWMPVEGMEWLRSYVGAPIQVKGVIVGFMNVDGTRPGQFSIADAYRLKALADHAAIAIENAQLYRELRRYADHLEELVEGRTAQLQAQYARLEAILRSVSDGIVLTDGNGTIIQANQVAQDWLERTLSPEDAARLTQTVRDLAQRVDERPDLVLELKGIDLQLSAAPIAETGEKGAVVAMHDVSHLKALDRMKSQFVSNVSHELRTPVTTIRLYVELMRRSSPQEWGEYLTVMEEEAERQAQLVEDILQISRIDSGRMELKPEPVDLGQLADEAVVSHQLLAQQRGLALELCADSANPMALVDAGRIMQVLNNLVENAIWYTKEGRVALCASTKEADGRKWATVAVTDTGIGIPEEELPHIFERFYRGRKVREMEAPGTGLGLAIVKEIVELHGGRVTVENEAGEGSTFVVWLPLAGVVPEQPA